GGINGDAVALVVGVATGEETGVDEPGPCGVQLRHEGVGAGAAERCLVGARRRGIVVLVGEPRHVGVAGGVHGNASTLVVAGGPEQGGVEEGTGAGRGGVVLAQEDIVGTAKSCIERTRRRGERRVGGVARHIGVAGGVHGNRAALIVGIGGGREK